MSNTKKLITPKATLSYPHLHQPQASDDGKAPKYSASLVFTPEILSDPKERALFEKLQDAAVAAINLKWPGKAEQMLKSESFRKGFRRDAEAKGYPAGSVYINVRSAQQPGIVFAHAGPDGKPVRMPVEEIKDQMYPGVTVRGSVDAYAYDQQGNKGVAFGMNNLQKIADGIRLDGRIAAEDEFTADLSQEPADLEALI